MSGPYRGDDRSFPLDITALRGAGSRPAPPAGVAEQTPLQRSLQLYLPELNPIPGATEFFVDEIVPSPAAGTLTPAALRIQLPASSLGIVRVFGAGIDDMTNATRIFFRLRVNTAPVPAWGNFRIFPGVAARATSSADTWVLVPSGGLIDVAIQNVDGAAYQVGVNYSGWFWPESIDRAWRGELFKQIGVGG